jgi:flagellar biosynthesis/type III secretory pathway protein FliH
LENTRLISVYILLDINRLSDEDLFAVGSIVSSVFVLDKERDREAFSASLAHVLIETQKLPDEERLELTHWIGDVLSKKKETYKELSVQALELIEKGDVDDMTYAIERMLDNVKKGAWKQGEEHGWKQGEAHGWKQGEEHGRKQGEAHGWKQGEAHGWKQGEEHGRQQEQRHSKLAVTILALRNAFSNGHSIYMVADLLNVSHDQADRIVDALQKNPNLSDSELATQLQEDSSFNHHSKSNTSV